jgi:hypothetical protein
MDSSVHVPSSESRRGVRARFAVNAGLIAASAILLCCCQPLALRTTIEAEVLPPEATDPWLTRFGDRSLTLTWAEPALKDMAAVQIMTAPLRSTSVTPVQAVLASGAQTATIGLPTNNAPYTITVYMVDKAGHVSASGVSTRNSLSFHHLFDQAGPGAFGSHPPVNSFTSQTPIATVKHFTGMGAGIFQGHDEYAYDDATGLPKSITSYDAPGNRTTMHTFQYAAGSIERVLDVLWTYNGQYWAITRYVNTCYDASGRITNTELYSGTITQVQYASTYSLDSSGVISGWVTKDASGAVTRRVSYHDQVAAEQWVICDPSGAIMTGGLVNATYDDAGRMTALTHYDTFNMKVLSKVELAYDSIGNLLKTTTFGGSPLVQEEYDVYAY